MIVLTWLAWLATATCLITYVRMQRGHSPAVFDWANVIGCVPLVAMDYIVGATPAAVVSLAFGVAGAHGRYTAWRERQTTERICRALRKRDAHKALMLSHRGYGHSHADHIEELRRGL